MLSPGQYHKRVPKDPLKNLKYRQFVLAKCRVDPALQAAMIEICAQDIFFYINTFVWQYNPKRVGHEVEPFITWDFQEDCIRRTMDRIFVEQDDMLWEKSREMGATWMALIIDDWTCLFHQWKGIYAISHSEEAVDQAGKKNTLFWKVQFMHEYLPSWLLRGVRKRKLSFTYPATESTFEGSATSERSGVGGRSTKILLDEFSKHTKDYEILGQTADTGPRLFIGTHYGTGTAFWTLTQRPDMRKIILHWSQHPEKKRGLYRFNTITQRVEILDRTYKFPPEYRFVTDGTPTGGPYPGLRSPWYDNECDRRANSRDVAMHLDINPEGSVSQVFDPLVINSLKNQYARFPDWEGELEYDPELGVPGEQALLPVPVGRIKCWFIPNQLGRPPARRYVVGVDPSTGQGATPSCVEVVDVETGEQVMEYANPFMDEKTLAVFCVAVCRTFADEHGHPARLIWETPGPGLVFGKKIIELRFANIYWRTDELKAIARNRSEIPGWNASPSTNRMVLIEMKGAMSKRALLVRSKEALDEALQFKYDSSGNPVHAGEYNTNDPSGARVNHGDRVKAIALAWWMAKTYRERVDLPIIVEPGIGSLAGRRIHEQQRQREADAWT